MGCGEKKATHLITQVQLRLRNGQAVSPSANHSDKLQVTRDKPMNFCHWSLVTCHFLL